MHKRALRIVYAIVVVCGVVYAFGSLSGPNGLRGLMEKRRLVHEYEEGNQKMTRDNEHLKQRIGRLKDNPSEQEMEIRQKLKLSGRGEKIFILDEAKPETAK